MLTPDTISPSPNEVLQALLNAHGLEARISGGRVVVIGHQAQWSGAVYFQPQDEVAHLQLDVNLHLPDGRTLVESFSGLGASHKFALGDAFDNFSRASFHVLLRAFFEVPDDEPQTWQMPLGSFRIFLGDVTMRGRPPVEGEELLRWVEPFLQVVQRAPLSSAQPHWIRLYYAQHEGKTVNQRTPRRQRALATAAKLPVAPPLAPGQRFLQPTSLPRITTAVRLRIRKVSVYAAFEGVTRSCAALRGLAFAR